MLKTFFTRALDEVWRIVMTSAFLIYWTCGTIGASAQQHELLARDINGFRLDMTVEEVQAIAHKPLTDIGAGQFQVSVGGVEYDFGFSVLRHLFRIDSKQDLGRFIPDKASALTLTAKLTKKYGRPDSNRLPDGPIGWGQLESYSDSSGLQLNRDAWTLTVYLQGGFGQSEELLIHLIDFRIMRRDLAKANAKPSDKAAKKAVF